MPDLIYFLEKNGFYPRREDIEAVLRRLDHDANKMLSFDEFKELTGNNDDSDADVNETEESKDAGQFDRTNETPLRHTLAEQQHSEGEEPKDAYTSPREK